MRPKGEKSLMAKKKSQRSFLKPNEVAELLRVEPGTVRVWAQSGRLNFSTTLGGHRRFTYRDVEAFARSNGLTLAAREGSKIRVLVVDDDKRVAGLISRFIKSASDDVELELAHDGFSAGQAVQKFEPHLIVLDLFMPGIDGFDLCKSLKADPATSNIRIVAITGDSSRETEKRILKYGAEVCLGKPINKAALMEAIGV